MESTFVRVQAIHRNWTGFLRLSEFDQLAYHEGHDSKGRYELTDRRLTVSWERYKPDVFLRHSGIYVHEDVIKELPAIEKFFALRVKDRPIIAKKVTVTVPE